MIISKTPFRMSFFGGGTDFENHFRKYGGSVLVTTFDRYCYVTVRHLPPFFDYSSHLTYSKTEYVNSVDEVRHPVIRNAMKMCQVQNIRMTYEADLPARSGLGTSSSFAVGLLNAFYALNGLPADKRMLADKAIHLERVLCNECGGWQDQIAAAFGGMNRINFTADGYEVLPIQIDALRKKDLNDRLMLFFTGFTRLSSEIQEENHLDDVSKEKQLLEIGSLVDEAERILTDPQRNLDEFGHLLDYSWKLKRKLGEAVTTKAIDALYQRGIEAGALGGKLLGAGGGGFLLFYVNPDRQPQVREAFKDLTYIPFSFEDQGTQVIHSSTDSEFTTEAKT